MVLRIGLLFGVLLLGGAVWRVRTLSVELGQPVSMQDAEYVGSASCRKCHGEHYASWHRTFHRRMTQEASADSVLGDFSGQELRYMGVTARMERGREGQYRMRFESGEENFTAQVVRTVGSHRYQQYLAREDDLYVRLPVAWDVKDQRFIHMNGAFLTADPQRPAPGEPIASGDYQRHVVRWNDNCIFCHNVAPNPRADGKGRFDSTVAELGVACEACHGPGGRHVRENRDPLRRYMQHLGVAATPDIASPGRMGSARSSEVCGRCHGQRITSNIDAVHRFGDRFIPGEPLSEYSKPLHRDTTLGGEEGVFAPRFWLDGTPRLTAYEYQGFLQSPCAKDEQFSCGSCHSMHSGDSSGQVRADLLLPAALKTEATSW